MKEYQNSEEVLRSILKEDGLEKPSGQYTSKLRDLIIGKYMKNNVEEFREHKWLASVILGMAILWSLLFLYILNPFSIQPVFCISVVAFILGFWGLIGLIKKTQISFFS